MRTRPWDWAHDGLRCTQGAMLPQGSAASPNPNPCGARRTVDRCEHGRCFYAFNSFFWKKLTERSGLDEGPHYDAAFARVAKWTKVGLQRSPGLARRPERAPVCALCGAFRACRGSGVFNDGQLGVCQAAAPRDAWDFYPCAFVPTGTGFLSLVPRADQRACSQAPPPAGIAHAPGSRRCPKQEIFSFSVLTLHFWALRARRRAWTSLAATL